MKFKSKKKRYAIINYRRLSDLLGLGSEELLKKAHAEWVEDALRADRHERDRKWSQAVVVGSASYIDKIKKNLGVKAIHRGTNKADHGFELREGEIPYNDDFDPESDGLSRNISHLWNVFH